METQTPSRRDLETALIEKCWKDPEFKREVVKDPKGMLECHTGQKLPSDVKIFVNEKDANTFHFSIPPAPDELAELSEEQLERVAGEQVREGDLPGLTIGPVCVTTGLSDASKAGW
jgi:hypothetical protein